MPSTQDEGKYEIIEGILPSVSLATVAGAEIESAKNSTMAHITISGTDVVEEKIKSSPKHSNPRNSLMSNDVAKATSFNVEVLSDVEDKMTAEEAMRCIEEINTYCNRIRVLLVDLESRQGYLALNFTSMSQLMKSNLFTKARSTLQLELQAGRIEKDYLNVPVGTLSERHLRPLSKLKPEHYKDAIQKAREIAGDRALVASYVSQAVSQMLQETPYVAKRSIVDMIKERNFVPLNERPSCLKVEIVRVRACGNPELRGIDGYWGVVTEVTPFRYQVRISLKDELIYCKEEEVEYLDLDETCVEQLRSVSDRIHSLVKCDRLSSTALAVLEALSRKTYFTDDDLWFLEKVEERYLTLPGEVQGALA